MYTITLQSYHRLYIFSEIWSNNKNYNSNHLHDFLQGKKTYALISSLLFTFIMDFKKYVHTMSVHLLALLCWLKARPQTIYHVGTQY